MLLSILSGLRQLIADPDVAIDLGTANTRLYARGYGMVADEPSVVKVDPKKGSIEAVGASAAQTRDDQSRDEDANLRLPLRAGVIADVDAATSLLLPLMLRARRLGLIKPRALACAPTDASEKERAALVEATLRAGASSVAIAPEPLAAAIGAGLDISSPYAQMLVDIGDGVTDMAVIRSGSLIATAAVRTACSDLHTAVHEMVKRRYRIALMQSEAERLTHECGISRKVVNVRSLTAIGMDCETGSKTSIDISNQEVITAIDPIINKIVKAVSVAVRDLPPMTACEVIESGICLTGGGARLNGMAELIAAETSLDVRPAADPLHAVINGARLMLTARMSNCLWPN